MHFTGRRWGLILTLVAIILVPYKLTIRCLAAAPAEGADRPALDNPGEELLLVREWDPKTGELIGWMPLHRIAIMLQQVSPQSLTLDLNDAVPIKMPLRPGEFDRQAVKIAPAPITVEGQKYIPIEREPNLVRVKKCLFYVKSIVFGESKYRNPTKPPS